MRCCNLRPRVLTISKPYVGAAYRDKLRLLAESGDFEIGLICPPAWGAQSFEPAGDESYWIRQVPIAWNGHNHFHVYRGLAAAIREFRPTVLNVEEEHYSLVTLQCFRLARQVGATPLFYTWQNIQKTYPPPFAWIERYVFRHAAAGVAGNAEAAAVLRAKGYLGPIAEIPQMGVDLARFAPAAGGDGERAARRRQIGLDEGAFWVGFVGRVVAEKGVDTLLEALARLRADQVGGRIRLLILGSGPHLAALEARAAALGIGDWVQWERQVASAQVPLYLQALDALCLPSLTRSNWKEQFGRVLIEAMAAEAVVVGSSSGEIPRVIGDAGVVFPEGDSAALAAALAGLVADPERVRQLRSAGAARVRARYTNAVVAKAFAAVFHAALAGQPAYESHSVAPGSF